jgi:hypothetical protein
MIRYALRCRKDHEFEAWFRSSGDFDAQARKKRVPCPICGDTKVEKALMAPAIGRAGKDKGRPEPAPAPAAETSETSAEAVHLAADPRRQALIQTMRELRKKITESADYVGDKFAEEARKIHYEEAEPRGIYGEASREDAEALTEEGIEFAPLPPVPEDRN